MPVTVLPTNGLSGAVPPVPGRGVLFLGEEVTLPLPPPLGPYIGVPATADPLLVFGLGATTVPG